jgi:heme exporter protein B
MRSINSVFALLKREFQITYRNFSDILSILLFFLLGIVIFVFAIGINKEIFNQISIGIIWTLILLSNTLSLRKFFQDDFDDNNIILFNMSGLTFEVIALIKIITIWLFLQAPFFLVIPIASILLNIEFTNLKMILLSFLIGSPIITCIASISGSMNLLNKKNFAIGSVIIMIFSIPVIIFGVNLIGTSNEVASAQINILLGIMFFFLSITPWVCAACIKLGLQNK